MPSCCRSAAIFPFWWIFSRTLNFLIPKIFAKISHFLRNRFKQNFAKKAKISQKFYFIVKNAIFREIIFLFRFKPFWRLPIEERACRKTDLGGGDYYLRNSGLPPSLSWCQFISLSIYHVKGMRYLSIYLQVAQSADSSTVHYTSVCYTNFRLSVSLLNFSYWKREF